MKKVRLFLAVTACCFAGAAVYANSVSVITFYYTTIAGSHLPSDCVNQFTGTVCPTGTAVQCSVIDDGNTLYITQKATAGSDCAVRMRTPL